MEDLHYIDRRVFSKAAVIGFGATQAAILADGLRSGLEMIDDVEQAIWPRNEPNLTFLSGHSYAGQPKIALYFPGFGDMHTVAGASDWQTAARLPQDLPVVAVDYSNEGATTGEIADMIRDRIDLRRVKALTLFGRSLGGLYAIAIAAELKVPVESLILCSTPSNFDNAYFGGASNIIAKLPTNRGLATSLKFAASMARVHQLHPGENLSEVGQTALQRTFSNASPVALQNQLKVGHSVDITSDKLVDKLRGVMRRGDTRVAYAASRYPNSDRTVKVQASGEDFKELFRDEIGVDYELFGVNYAGHADVEKTAAYTADWQHESLAA